MWGNARRSVKVSFGILLLWDEPDSTQKPKLKSKKQSRKTWGNRKNEIVVAATFMKSETIHYTQERHCTVIHFSVLSLDRNKKTTSANNYNFLTPTIWRTDHCQLLEFSNFPTIFDLTLGKDFPMPVFTAQKAQKSPCSQLSQITVGLKMQENALLPFTDLQHPQNIGAGILFGHHKGSLSFPETFTFTSIFTLFSTFIFSFSCKSFPAFPSWSFSFRGQPSPPNFQSWIQFCPAANSSNIGAAPE